MSSQPYYAVSRGKEGEAIYRTWPQCKQQVEGFPNARYKKFSTEKEARQFIEDTRNEAPFKFTKKDANGNPVSSPTNDKKKTLKRTYDQGSNSRGTSSGSRYNPANKKAKKSTEERGWNYTNKSQPQDSDWTVVYTDGACINNGRFNAKAGIGVYWGEHHKDNVSERLKGRQTNNCAEIQAAVRAVNQAKARGITKLIIRTDSKFMLQAINEWVPKWKRNNWKTSTGGDVINKKDFLELLDAMEEMEIRWEKVRGHSGIHGNEMADKFATAGVHK